MFAVNAVICLTVVHVVCSVKDAEVCKEREALESAKRTLEHKIIELEQELDTQRRDITTSMILPNFCILVDCVEYFCDTKLSSAYYCSQPIW